MSSAQLYDTIGATYTATRRTEPRIAAQVWAVDGELDALSDVCGHNLTDSLVYPCQVNGAVLHGVEGIRAGRRPG